MPKPLKKNTTIKEASNLLKQKLTALDESAIVAITDAAGIITHANDRFSEITGYTKEELIGKDHRILNSGYHPKEYFSKMWETISSGKTWRGEIKNKRKDGTYYWVNSTIVPLKDRTGKVFQYVAIRFDVTGKKAVEEELQRAKDDALNAVRVKSEFLANMSHEIRTPMNGILGMCNLLLDDISDPKAQEKLKIISNCGNTLLELVNDLLDFSKLEAGKVELENIPFNLTTMIDENIQLLTPKAGEKGIKLIFKPDPSTPDWIQGDVTRLRQIITNLTSNAIKFTQNGSVEILTKSETMNDGNLLIEVSVKDSGIGIPTSEQKNLFQSFSQVDASTTRKFGGTGLGLAICKGLAEKMGGQIWFESKVGEGSTFSFDFIAGVTTAPKIATQTLSPFVDLKKMGQTHPLRILIAEDNRINQMVVAELLKKLGYKAAVVSNGRDALEFVKTNDCDLVLMDCHMPELDGYDATTQICLYFEDAQKTQPKVVALTASTLKEDIDRCIAAGMDGVLSKPIELSSLIKLLNECPNQSDYHYGESLKTRSS